MLTSPLIAKRYARLLDLGPAQAHAVTLLHGFAADGSCWRSTAEALAARGHRALAPDLPGHGIEGGASSHECTMDQAAARLVGMLDHLGIERTSLAGYSMGGRLALYFALAHPERVDALVLVSASAGLEQRDWREARLHADERWARMLGSEGIEAFVDRWQAQPLFAPLERGAPGHRQAVRNMRLRCSPEGLAASLRGMGAGVQPYLGARLDELSMPVLIVAGALDEKFRQLAVSMHEAVPASVLDVVEDCGHVVHVEAPERFHAALFDFLDRETLDTREQAHAGGHP